MGFESAQGARRRLALVAAHRQEVQAALAGGLGEGIGGGVAPRELVSPLEELARDILGTPGAGGALLVAYAAQARALALVLEAVQRSERAPLPASVVRVVRQALTTLAPMPSIPLGVERGGAPSQHAS